MLDFLESANDILDKKLYTIEADLIEATTTYLESAIEYEGMLFVESKKPKETLSLRIQKFFKELIISFTHFVDSIRIEVDRRVRDAQYEKKFRRLFNELREKQKQGVTTIRVHDLWTMRDKYLECTKELKSLGKKFVRDKYKHVEDIDKDIALFNAIMEKHKLTLAQASEIEVEIPIDKYIRFIEDEVSGRGKVVQSLNENIAFLQQLEADCLTIERQREIMGADVVTKHVGFVRKVSLDVSKFVKKWASRIISTAVIIFVS